MDMPNYRDDWKKHSRGDAYPSKNHQHDYVLKIGISMNMMAVSFVFGIGYYMRGGHERRGVIQLARSNVANVYFEFGEYIHPMHNVSVVTLLQSTIDAFT
jgi:hypothetical protein